jgi:hypothetical protein
VLKAVDRGDKDPARSVGRILRFIDSRQPVGESESIIHRNAIRLLSLDERYQTIREWVALIPTETSDYITAILCRSACQNVGALSVLLRAHLSINDKNADKGLRPFWHGRCKPIFDMQQWISVTDGLIDGTGRRSPYGGLVY